MAAASATCRNGTPTKSAMMKAAAAMMGGMIWPPMEATASTAAAKVAP
jgi:hypothetical protein